MAPVKNQGIAGFTRVALRLSRVFSVYAESKRSLALYGNDHFLLPDQERSSRTTLDAGSKIDHEWIALDARYDPRDWPIGRNAMTPQKTPAQGPIKVTRPARGRTR